MRYIPLREHRPSQEWVDKTNALLQQLDSAVDSTERRKIIEENSDVWGDLKEWLLSLSDQKCWFSEAKDCFSHWDVEHYRPKKSAKDADGTEYDGYWWLSFDWTNLRICGNVGNRKKGTFFPLRAGCPRVARGGDLRQEVPTLLDPADPYDPVLISFDMEGRAIPAPGCTDPWDVERVQYSVKRYRLDYFALEGKRKVVWHECWTRIQNYLEEFGRPGYQDNPIARQMIREKAKEILSMMNKEMEFSAVARACVLSTGDPRVTNLLRSA